VPATENIRDQQADSEAYAPVESARSLLGVGAALILLTAIMIVAAKVDMGSCWRITAIAAAASVQAVLIGLYFMHLRWDHGFHALIVVVGILAVIAFMALTSMDTSQSEPEVIPHAAEPAAQP